MEHGLACQVIARLAVFAPEVAQAAEAASELDCILALAAAARELNLCRPQVAYLGVAGRGWCGGGLGWRLGGRAWWRLRNLSPSSCLLSPSHRQSHLRQALARATRAPPLRPFCSRS